MQPVRARSATMPAPTLFERLGETLYAEGVVCCQVDGPEPAQHGAPGASDVDLLVDPAWAERLDGALDRLGFKPAVAPPEAQIPGRTSWFGYDSERQELLHVRVHHRLIVGNDWTTAYQLPIERAVLETAVSQVPFPQPARVLRFIVYVLRHVQSYGVFDLVPSHRSRRLADAHKELTYLLAHVDRRQLVARLGELLPTVDVPFFDACTRSLRPGASRWRHFWLRQGLHRRLRPHACRPPIGALARRLARRLRGISPDTGLHLAHGGAVLALLGEEGPDGSSYAPELATWLGAHFDVLAAGLGNPPRSLATRFVDALLKLRRAGARARDGARAADTRTGAPGALDLLRLVCTARDRYHLFARARRFAAAGGIALCERYPIPEIRLLVGPEIGRLVGHGRDTPLARWLLRAERWYYHHITPPDGIIVLMVDPEVAVQRASNALATHVRARCRLLWETDWSRTAAQLVDASRPSSEVRAEVKALVWSDV